MSVESALFRLLNSFHNVILGEVCSGRPICNECGKRFG